MTLAQESPDPAGCPAELLVDHDVVVLRMALVDAVGFDAAVVFQRIEWRCQIREGGWIATYDEIAAETRLSRDRVARAVKVLRERGWLTSERADQWTPTQRWIPVIARESQYATHERGGLQGAPHVSSDMQRTCDAPAPAPSYESKETEETSPRKPPKGGGAAKQVDDDDPAWSAFWSAYPRKVGKGGARKAWAKALRAVDAETILDGLAAHLPALTAEHRRGYCPHPSTWLNQERWADDVAAVEGARSGPDPNAAVMRRDPATRGPAPW